MPTGYTHAVQTGEVTELKDFALQCARNFGALILMRDEPMDAPIPEKFEASDYHDKNRREAEKELEELGSRNEEDWRREAKNRYIAEMQSYEQRVAEKTEQAARYDAMIAKVQAWEPPTSEHQGLKEFMLSQLKESKDWDCNEPTKPEMLGWEAYRDQSLKSAQWSYSYHLKQGKEEKERAESRTKWVRALRESLEAV